MKKKLSKKVIISIFVVGIVFGLTFSYMFVPTTNGIETTSGFKASCIDLFGENSAGKVANKDLIEGINNGIEEYIGTRIKLNHIVVYRELDSKTFVASTSGVGVFGSGGKKIFSGTNGKENYLKELDKTGANRFVLEGKTTTMLWLNEPGPYEDLQLCDIYGTYLGTRTIKDTDGTKTILPLINVSIVDKASD